MNLGGRYCYWTALIERKPCDTIYSEVNSTLEHFLHMNWSVSGLYIASVRCFIIPFSILLRSKKLAQDFLVPRGPRESFDELLSSYLFTADELPCCSKKF